MASVSAGTHIDRPSFAKVAAAGLKPPSAPQQNSSSTAITQKHEMSSLPRDGTTLVTPSYGSASTAFTPKQKKLVPFVPKDSKEADSNGKSGPEVLVHNPDTASPPTKSTPALDGMLMPSTCEEAPDQVSSSSGSGKPPSLDGKSVASGTTFTLDEKESLRPDDSASVKATEDEEVFSQPGSGLPGSRTGSDDGLRAFRDQLREISAMEPSRSPGEPQEFRPPVNPTQGVLYVPPQGPGVGTVPGSVRAQPGVIQGFEYPPDPKLLEALESPKDRIMVLKLEQDIVDFVKDAKESSLKLPQTNAFYRMLAHKLADYYMLGHIVDESTMAVCIYKTPSCRLPPPLTGIATPSTAASTPPPSGQQLKILRRGVDGAGPAIVNGSNAPSKTNSENGESGYDDDKKSKLPQSREEREARYEAARRRIMGPSMSSESAEDAIDKDNSRSSSTAGRKPTKKKQRADSDDDFQGRDAYSAYYPTQIIPGGSSGAYYGFPTTTDSHGSHFNTTTSESQHATVSYAQCSAPANGHWPENASHAHVGTPNWVPNPQFPYDLSSDFHRAMSFQQSSLPPQNPPTQAGYATAYNQQYVGAQHSWPQQSPYVSSYPSPGGQSFMHGYQNPLPSSPGSFQHAYPYGQLPSQTYPGRAPSNLEHPLPGSYKGRHFNPQSQAFVPRQTSGVSASPVTTQSGIGAQSAYATMPPQQRHSSAPSPNPAFGPHHTIPAAGPPARIPNQPMTHPLPQPVFARQPSPNMPLPPKPEATPPRPMEMRNNSPGVMSRSHGQSTIAKWGTPASLPVKPPPSIEPFDASRFAQAQAQRQSPANTRIPSFGGMPQANAGLGMYGQTLQSPRRA